ncbi:MAG: flavodoxin family protein [Anaerolineae bacterium]
MAVKAVVIAGSPRKGGNSDILAGRLVAGLQQGGAAVELLHARDLNVAPCRACYYCSRSGECITKDDAQRLYELFLTSHRVCLVTPIFFCQTPAITQAIIERCQTLWTRKYHRHEEPPELDLPRRGLIVGIGGTRGSKVFDSLRCLTRFWFDTMNIRDYDVLTYNDVDEKGAILQRPEALQEVFEAGLRLAAAE